MEAYPYRCDEGLGLEKDPPSDEHCVIEPKFVLYQPRRPVMVSVGCHVDGACLPHPDPKDLHTGIQGAKKRFVSQSLKIDPLMLSRFAKFVEKWISMNLTPLDFSSDTSFERWIEKTNYPLWRKAELRTVRAGFDYLADKDRKLNSFGKYETYLEYKHLRLINARTDEFKVYSGPVFKLIEEQLFAMDWFIKKVPISERPAYIKNIFEKKGTGLNIATDYTSFEASFQQKFMLACEMVLYKYMVKALPGGLAWFKEICRTMTGVNYCDFGNFIVKVLARRMSGEMCTSLGNSFSNLMLFLFACEESGLPQPVGVVEGDDGAFKTDELPDESIFTKLGFKMKMVGYDNVSDMSFCGLVFDVDDLVNVTDPIEYLVSFSWLTSRYTHARKSKLLTLLRCKALSFAHQFPGCPIISALAQYGLRVTRSHDVRHMIFHSRLFDEWTRAKLIAAYNDEKRIKVIDPPIKTRILVSRLYGIGIEQQKSIEQYLSNKQDLSPFCHPLISHFIPAPWCHYASFYTKYQDGSMDMNFFVGDRIT